MRIVKIEEEGVGKENKSIEKYFAYQKWRKYQKEIAEIIYESLKNNKEHVVLEAPTGLGKTSAVLSATLPIIIDNELKLLWCCRTHQQIIGVLNEVMKIKRKESKFIEPIGLWGRRQLCVNNSINILDESCFHHACSILRKSFKCPYFRPEDQWIIDNVKNITYPNEAKNVFQKYQFCP